MCKFVINVSRFFYPDLFSFAFYHEDFCFSSDTADVHCNFRMLSKMLPK